MSYRRAVLNQAWMNYAILPWARRQRAKGLEIKTSIFSAPLLKDKSDFDTLRMKEFQAQYDSPDQTVYAWDGLDKRSLTRFAQATARLAADADGYVCWSIKLQNVDTAGNPLDNEDAVSIQTLEFSPIETMQQFEACAQNGMQFHDVEEKANAEGMDYSKDHIMHVLWRLFGRHGDSAHEIDTRRWNALIHGTDLRGNWGRNDGRSIWRPNQYTYF